MYSVSEKLKNIMELNNIEDCSKFLIEEKLGEEIRISVEDSKRNCPICSIIPVRKEEMIDKILFQDFGEAFIIISKKKPKTKNYELIKEEIREFYRIRNELGRIQNRQIKIKYEKFHSYFSESFTSEEVEDELLKAIEFYRKHN